MLTIVVIVYLSNTPARHLMTVGGGRGVEAAPGQGRIVSKMTHHLAWTVFLRHTLLVPCPLQAAASIKPAPSSALTGGRGLCLPVIRMRQVEGTTPMVFPG